ncbi:DUF5681 domain-containing protein [Bradyrhizobium sp. AUGA SZCCT0182]|uniref:DUF5681 domain-containing protein n=1 Tax=Bradyrhizobium sp. AUGA SZCCT0182 TaxID=2807667 RepID=UPI001BAB5541|nr:DUF5681 domain-containing protein [Bradyrhizobium sp. AUGA SZCCT0182]MBR1237471.1 hypothetical protein [Bradyrhizobium sp. AUGA SZCCT0182]
MAADHSDDNEDDKVGYCKPPSRSQWKPGQCGNPRGRPKGALNYRTEVKLMLAAPVVVNDNGKRKRMTTVRASLWRVREMALKGNIRCLEKVIECAAEIDGVLATEPLGDDSKDDQAILDAYREEIRAERTKDDPGSRNDDGEDPK